MWSKCVNQVSLILTFSTLVSSFMSNYYKNVFREGEIIDELLPNSVIPSSYNLKLFPNIHEGHFRGSVSINVTCQKSTPHIILHAHEDLQITEVTVMYVGNSHFLNAVTSRNLTMETLTITLEETLVAGTSYQLNFVFNSTFSEDIAHKHEGFFKDSYKDELTGEKRWYAAANMLPTNARKIFPCFDEPSFKATFQISIVRLANMFTLSVMPREFTEPAEIRGWVWDHFPPTPPISTFSLGFLISDIQKRHTMNVSNTQIHIYYATRENLKLLPEVEKSTPKMLEFLSNFLDVSYPLQKLDIVFLPEMNYGLQANSFGILMVSEDYVIDSTYTTAIFPSLVYQWFHHTVTPNQWKDFNITIPLGSYLAKIGYTKISNSENWYTTLSQELYTRFNSPNRQNFIEEFGENWFAAKDELGEWFLRMLNSTLTEETFRRALTNLILMNKYSTFTEDLLWETLTSQAMSDGTLLPLTTTVKHVSESWITKNSRFPVVTMNRNYENRSASFEQHTFSSAFPRDLTKKEKSRLWWIPITYITSENFDLRSAHTVQWMRAEKNISISGLPEPHSSIIMNPADSGFFLVNYDHHNWRLITQNLLEPESQIPTSTRIKLLHDAFVLASGGELNFGTALNLTLFLNNESEPSVWATMIFLFVQFENNIAWTPVEDKFMIYMQNLLLKMFAKLDRNTEGELDAAFWPLSESVLCGTTYQPCLDKFREELDKIMTLFTMKDKSTQKNLFCPEFMRNVTDEWPAKIKQLAKYLFDQIERESRMLHKNIAKCPGYVEMIQRTADWLLEPSTSISHEEVKEISIFLSGTPASRQIMLNFVMQWFDDIKEKYTKTWIILFGATITKLKKQEDMDKVILFYNQNKEKFGDNIDGVEITIREAKKFIAWNKKNLSGIKYWFKHVLPHIENL